MTNVEAIEAVTINIEVLSQYLDSMLIVSIPMIIPSNGIMIIDSSSQALHVIKSVPNLCD
jgi:hypothetical protein